MKRFPNDLIFVLALICAVTGLPSSSTAQPDESSRPSAHPLSDADATAIKQRSHDRYPELFDLYRQLHQHPELSLQEEQTAKRLAPLLAAAGYEVTTGVGGHGIVALLHNGKGHTLMIRTDLDALPVEENTGLPYASTVMATDAAGKEVPVMHACGHDVHMTCLIGTSRVLAAMKDRWKGTLMLIGQPAEEGGLGAQKMLDDGLFTRFPKPDYALALHVNANYPAGVVVYVEGHALANVDSVDITIRGRGGHGASPHTTIDPILLAARTVIALQSIVAREINPMDHAVVTVGSIHGGTKHNVIPDEVKLQLTIRSYKDEVRGQIKSAIKRIVYGEAQSAGAPEPVITYTEGIPSTYNDPALIARCLPAFEKVLGKERVEKGEPVMGGEDFGLYGRSGVPAFLFWLGAVGAEKVAASKRPGGPPLPSLHSALFAPLPQPTIEAGVSAMSAAALHLLQD